MNKLEDSKYFREEESEGEALKRRLFKRDRSTKRDVNYGVILSFLFMLSGKLLNAFRSSLFGYLISSLYTTVNARWKSGALYRFFKHKSEQRKRQSLRAGFAKIYEASLISRVIDSLSVSIIQSNVRLWGVGLFTFAFMMIFVIMVRYYFTSELLYDRLVLGALISVLSIPLMISRKRVGETATGGRAASYITLHILSLDESKYERDDSRSGGNYGIALAIAGSLGLLTYVVEPLLILQTVLMIAVFAVVMCYPELGIMTSLAFIPFSNIFENPSLIIFFLIIISLMSFILKFMRGKRVVEFELIDVMVFIFGGLILLGGIFTSGGVSSFYSAALYVIFISIYFLVLNSYIRKTWIYRGIKVLVVITSITAIFGILEDMAIGSILMEVPFVSDVVARLTAFLGNPNMLGAFLVIVFPIVLAQMIVTKRGMSKFWYALGAIAVFGCMIMTWSRGAWLGLIVAVLVFLVAYDFRTVWLVVAGIMTSPIWVGFLPQSFINRFLSIIEMSDASVMYRFSTWSGVIEMIKDHFFEGIGIGESSFRTVYQLYAISGTEDVAHSHNLFLEVFAQLGVFGFILFACIIVMYFQKCLSSVKGSHRESKSRTMIAAGLASIAGALVMGLTDYIWYNYRVFLIFWSVIALTVALIRINEKQLAKEEASATNNGRNVDIEIG